LQPGISRTWVRKKNWWSFPAFARGGEKKGKTNRIARSGGERQKGVGNPAVQQLTTSGEENLRRRKKKKKVGKGDTTGERGPIRGRGVPLGEQGKRTTNSNPHPRDGVKCQGKKFCRGGVKKS